MPKNARDAPAVDDAAPPQRRRRVSDDAPPQEGGGDETEEGTGAAAPARVGVVVLGASGAAGGRFRLISSPRLASVAAEGGGDAAPFAARSQSKNQQPMRTTEAGAVAHPEPKGPKTAAAAAAAAPAVDVLKGEIQDLLEKKLMGIKDDSKVEALQTLNRIMRKEGPPDHERNDERMRWVVELQGGYLVLMLLRRQLDKVEAGRPTQRTQLIVFHAICFLCAWNYHSKSCRNDTSKFGGVEAVVRAMDAYPVSRKLQENAIHSLLRFSRATDRSTSHAGVVRHNRDASDDASAVVRRRELVKAGVILRTVRVLTATSTSTSECLVGSALNLLETLCDVATPDVVKALNDMGAVVTFAKLWNQYHQKNQTQPPPQSQATQQKAREASAMAACLKWINKLTS